MAYPVLQFQVIDSARYAEIVETSTFERAARKLFDEDQLSELVWAFAQRPDAGVVMPRTGGFRKLRFALEGRGKSGSARVIYYYVDRRERVYLVYAYAKSERETLSREQAKELRRLARLLDAEG